VLGGRGRVYKRLYSFERGGREGGEDRNGGGRGVWFIFKQFSGSFPSGLLCKIF